MHFSTVLISLIVLNTLCQCRVDVETHFRVCSKTKLVTSENVLKEDSAFSQLECSRACKNNKDCQSANVQKQTEGYVCQLRNDTANNCSSLTTDPLSNTLIRLTPGTQFQALRDCFTILSKNSSACPANLGYTCNSTASGPVCLKYLLDSDRNHETASNECSAEPNGHLVFIENDGILQVVREKLLSSGLGDSVWLDGYDVYYNNTRVSWNGREINFPEWDTGYPVLSERCTRLSRSSGFAMMKSKDCASKYFTVCQKDMY